MASARYTRNIKPEDLQPDAPPAPMTKQEKWRNFWFYYKWWVLGGLAAVFAVIYIVYDIAGTVKPDFEIGLVSEEGLPGAIVEKLSKELSESGLIPDVNGDGKVSVVINEYTVALGGAEAANAEMQMAGTVKLTADFQMNQSALFLTDDLQALNEVCGLFNEGEGGAQIVAWSDCPGLGALDLTATDTFSETELDGAAYLQNFVMARRTFTEKDLSDDKIAAKANLADALLAAWREGGE